MVACEFTDVLLIVLGTLTFYLGRVVLGVCICVLWCLWWL